MKNITEKQGLEIAENLAEYNQRGRLLVAEANIGGYLVERGLRLEGLNAYESASSIFEALKKSPGSCEYEPGRLHLNAR